MRKGILLGIGAWLFIVSAVIIALAAWALGLSSITRYSALPDDEKVNENIVVVEDSVKWKLISRSDDRGNNSRISFKFTLRNPTGSDIQVSAYGLRIRFYDFEGFALSRYNYADAFTVPANGEYTYSAPHDLRGGLGEQVAFVEVLGVRSK
ncbi:MAG: hypothetical protein F4Y02_03460 [Chloroflexi bacterium]|nr:hypothetical protein [Chloroflexota bacterium]